MNGTLLIDLPKTYKKKQRLEFESGRREFEEFIELQKKLSALECLIGLLSDLTTQEITEFDEAVKRRSLFEK